MKLRTRASRAVFAAIAAAVAVNFVATSALASSTTLDAKVIRGGFLTASSNKVTLKAGSVTVTCSPSGSNSALAGTGSIPNGTRSGPAPLKVGTVKSLRTRNCAGPSGAVTMTFGKLPYTIKVDAATTSYRETDMMISGIDASVSMTGCSFTVTGSAPGYYTNEADVFTGIYAMTLTTKVPVKPMSPAQLTVSNVRGCSGVVNGQHPTLSSIILILDIIGPIRIVVTHA